MTNSQLTGKPAAPRRSRPIVVYLVVLALVAFVPVMAFAAVLLQRNNEAQQEIVQTLIMATTEAIGRAVDGQTEGMITTLKGFSSAPKATDSDLRDLYTRAQYALAGTGSYLALVDDTYQALFTTRVPYGTPLPKSPPSPGIQKAFETGQIVISDATFGATAGTWVIAIYMPIAGPNGHRELLAITQNADSVGAALLGRKLPEDWKVALSDSKNVVIASSPDAKLAAGGPFFIPRAPALTGKTGWRHLSIDDREYVSIASTSTDTGWSIVAWAPAAAVERPLSNSLLTLILGGIVIVAAASIATYLLSREITRSVRGLARDARRLGSGEAAPPRDYPISEIADVAGAIAAAARQRRAAETEVRFLMRELAHRSKNQMTVIAAMAKQTARGADSVPEFVQSFEKRIFGLARSTDLLLANGIAGVDLEELLTHQIDPFCPLDGARVELSGPSVRLNTQAAQILGMAGHELATNAAKYGAFSTDDGQLRVTWTLHDGIMGLVWREKLKALVRREERRGFGTTVLESMVGASLGAEVKRALHDDGIEWTFDIPFASLDPDQTPDAPADEPPADRLGATVPEHPAA
jgi:two-component sensor histidine kinase